MFTKSDSTDVVLGACANLEGKGHGVHNPHWARALLELKEVLALPRRAPQFADQET